MPSSGIDAHPPPADSALLDAIISVTAELHEHALFRRMVQQARELVPVRHGVLGVVTPDGVFGELIQEGGDPEQRTRFTTLAGHPPPLNQADLGSWPGQDLLVVPVYTGDQLAAVLYLIGTPAGFTDDDERTVRALAGAVGIALHNARLHERGRQRERWLEASTEIAATLLAETEPANGLRLVTERARAVAAAPIAAIALPKEHDPAKLVFTVVDTPNPVYRQLAGAAIDVAGTASGMVFTTGRPLLLNTYGEAAANWRGEQGVGFPPQLKELGSAAIVPLAAGEDTLGVLLLSRLRSERPFEESDLELLRSFAAHAALALQYSRAQAARHQVAVFEERDRIASDLHNLVIRRLFDVGLGMHGVVRLVRPEVRDRMSGLVDDLDRVISDLRRSIFSLQDAGDQVPGSLVEEVLRTARDTADALGFEPRVGLSGPLDSTVPGQVRPDLLATVREALSNVARHARATAVTADLKVDRDGRRLTLDVIDDGVGITVERTRSSGLRNLARRAGRWGGTMTVAPALGGGTHLTWSVPLPVD